MVYKFRLSNPRKCLVLSIYQITSIVRIRLCCDYKIVFNLKNKIFIDIYIINIEKRKIIKWLNYFTWQILVQIDYCWKKRTCSFIRSISNNSKIHYVCRIRIALCIYSQIISRSCSSIHNTWEITYVIG